MGVGDYVHSKEGGQPRVPSDLGPSQRQLRAAQAKIEIPVRQSEGPHLNGSSATMGLGFQRVSIPVDQQPRALPTNGEQRDVFDTDVEAIDDSTIAATSVFGYDDNQSQVEFNGIDPHTEISPRPSHLPRPTRKARASWYAGSLGDKAMKKAGFDSDDANDTSSQLTSSAGAEDEKTQESREPSSWFLSHKHRSAEEPLSKRLESFWSASRRTPKTFEQAQTETRSSPAIPSPETQPRKLGHMLPSSGPRKITLPATMSGTPRTRFSPPKPSLLDQLDISSIRHESEPPLQAGQAFHPTGHSDDEDENEVDIDETIRVSSRRESGHSSQIFDATNLTDLDRNSDDAMLQDEILSHATTRGRRNTVIKTRKRHIEADYPPELLCQKSFAELQAEPFDKAPTPPPPPPAKSPSLPPQPSMSLSTQLPNSTVSHLMALSSGDRQAYLSRMSVDQWEACGDQLIDRFSHLLNEMKNLRRARRRTAAIFENEVKRRHDQVEAQNIELSDKLEEMRTGGAQVLCGRRG